MRNRHIEFHSSPYGGKSEFRLFGRVSEESEECTGLLPRPVDLGIGKRTAAARFFDTPRLASSTQKP